MTGGEQGPPHLPLGSDMRPPPWPCQEETSLYLYLVPWETDLERRRSAGSFPSCPNALRAEPGGCRKQGGGTPQREKGNSGLSQWHPCQSHRDSVQTPFKAALTWDPCAWCWSVTGSELPQVRGTFLGRGALGSWGGFSENVQGDHGSRARLLHRALEVGSWEHTIAPITHVTTKSMWVHMHVCYAALCVLLRYARVSRNSRGCRGVQSPAPETTWEPWLSLLHFWASLPTPGMIDPLKISL